MKLPEYMTLPRRKINLVGWQSWSDTRRSSGIYPRRYFSPHGQNNLHIDRKSYFINHKSPPIGWCSWPYFGPHINEQIILEQASAAAKLGLEYILIDDGWTTWGDWLYPDSEKFPHGLKWLVKKIKLYGLKTGIWWAPLLAKSSSVLFHTHPDWFIPNLEGTQVLPLDIFISDKRRVLDLENPQVSKYLSLVLDYFLDCGLTLIKSDFLYAGHFNPKFTTSRVPDTLLHELLATCRKHFYSIACGCPLAPAVGVVDAMRISDDINIPQLNRLWPINHLIVTNRLNQLLNNYKLRQVTKSIWHLDPDAFISDPVFGITTSQSQKLASLIKQADGLIFLGDNLVKISPPRLKLTEKLIN